MKNKIIKIIEDITNARNLAENLAIDLLESGILDSLAFIELITKLEDEFDVEIQPTQINPNCWRTINKIVELIDSLV